MNALGRFLFRADRILRGDARTGPGRLGASRLMAALVVFSAFYGAVMGSYGGFRVTQMLFSSLKVPLLLLATFVLSLPSFFVVNSLMGLRKDFPRVVRALLSAQAGLSIVLASFAPFTALCYASTHDYHTSVLFNGLMFGTASLSAQQLLFQLYRDLIAADRRHALMYRLWIVVYAFVGIQMGWILRPFIGDPNTPVQFLRDETWGNAYLVVFDMIWDWLW